MYLKSQFYNLRIEILVATNIELGGCHIESKRCNYSQLQEIYGGFFFID